MFSLEVFDINFKRYGFIEHYTYASYTEKMTDSGYFEIKCPAIKDNIEKIQINRLVWFENDTAGIIQCIIKEKSEVIEMTVKGLLLNGILEWRYIYPTITVTDMDAILAMKKYVVDNMISSSDSRRNFPMLELGKDINNIPVTKITKQITGYTVMNGLQKICDSIPENVGFKVGFYPREGKFKFYTFVGVDKTIKDGQVSKQVYFSQNFNNVLSLSYTNNNEDFRGCALIQAELRQDNVETISTFKEIKVKEKEESLYVKSDDITSIGYDEEQNKLYVIVNGTKHILDSKMV